MAAAERRAASKVPNRAAKSNGGTELLLGMLGRVQGRVLDRKTARTSTTHIHGFSHCRKLSKKSRKEKGPKHGPFSCFVLANTLFFVHCSIVRSLYVWFNVLTHFNSHVPYYYIFNVLTNIFTY